MKTLLWNRSSRFVSWGRTFRKSFANRDVYFFTVRFKNHNCHLSTSADSNIKKNWWVVCDAQLFQAPPPSVTANQCLWLQSDSKNRREQFLTTINPPAAPSVSRWFKCRDQTHTAGPNQWMVNGQYIRWIRANGWAQWTSQRPWPSSHQEAPREHLLCFRCSGVRNQSYYPGEERKQTVSGLFSGFVWVNGSSVRLCTF